MQVIGIFMVLSILFGVASLQDLFGLGSSNSHTGGRKKNKCSECTDQYQTAKEQYRKDGDLYSVCYHITQTKHCLTRLVGRKPECNLDIQVLQIKLGYPHELRKLNCSAVSRNSTRLPTRPTKLPSSSLPPSNHCVYKPKAKDKGGTSPPLHCGLFGDPHLKTFMNKRQTCVVEGAWALLDNRHLAVQVTNTNVQLDESRPVERPIATATSKITVVIKKQKDGCAEQKVYQARSGVVPLMFRDGSTRTGPEGCITKLRRETSGTGVQLDICNLNTTIIIRQVGKYLTFNIRTPEEFVRESEGLCVTGCPESEMIDYNKVFNNHPNTVSSHSNSPTMTDNHAMNLCERANLTDFYYDSCVFDLITTGDVTFSTSAYSAMTDAIRMDPQLRLRRDNSIALKVYKNSTLKNNNTKLKKPTSSGFRTHSWTLFYYVLLVLWHSLVKR